MILALDIGNTNIVIGCIEDGKILSSSRIATNRNRTVDEYAVDFQSIFLLNQIHPDHIEGCIISSVVPPLVDTLVSTLKKVSGKTPLVVGPGVKTGLNIRIDNPAQLGSDLVAAAVAANAEYTKPIILVDLGTATTVSVIDEYGSYLGGMIIPGVQISQEALTSRTSLLQSITFDAPIHVIGTNTNDCMKSGAIYGNAVMIDGIADLIEDTLKKEFTIIATGGLANCIIPYCRRKIILDENLLLKGLWLIYEKNKDSHKQ